MQTAFIKKEITYNGSQLSSHFAYREFGILGDCCLAFLGPCDVSLQNMVDLEDVRKNAPIYSPRMLHFILETFGLDLKGGVLLQRLLVVQVAEQLRSKGITQVERRGDDLFINEKKLSVSIATRSPVSTLIHLGINVLTEGTPVPTVGLGELKLDPKEFGENCLERFRKEYLEVLRATQKVRAVR